MRRVFQHRPSPAVLIAFAALFVALGGGAYAAAKIGSAQIKNNSVRTKDIRNRTIRGKDVHSETITRRQIRDPEAYHAVGASGEPPFKNGAHNFGFDYATTAFFKDNDGIVHLKGTMRAADNQVAFTLPPGYRPAQILDIGVIAQGATGFIYISPNGDVKPRAGTSPANYGLDSVTFRADGGRTATRRSSSPHADPNAR
jgi:hypothetical protein